MARIYRISLFIIPFLLSQCGSIGLHKEISLIVPGELKESLSWKKNHAVYEKKNFVRIELSLLKDPELFEITDLYFTEKGKYRRLPLVIFRVYIKNLSKQNIEFRRWQQYLHSFLSNQGVNARWIKTESSWSYFYFQNELLSKNYRRFQFDKLFYFFPNTKEISEELYRKIHAKDKSLKRISKKQIEKKLKGINFRGNNKIYEFPATRYDKYVVFPDQAVMTLVAWKIPGPEIRQFVIEINLLKNMVLQEGILFPFEQRIIRKDLK